MALSLVLLVAAIVPLAGLASPGQVVFRSYYDAEELVLLGVDPSGRLRPHELDMLARLFRSPETGQHHAVHPLLARHLVRLARRLAGPVVIVSGYRETSEAQHHSYHGRGMAADILSPGVAVEDVRNAAVEQRIGGVGFFPNGGFVHVDVRPRRQWWVDYSAPDSLQTPIPDPEGTAPARPPEQPVVAEGPQLSIQDTDHP